LPWELVERVRLSCPVPNLSAACLAAEGGFLFKTSIFPQPVKADPDHLLPFHVSAAHILFLPPTLSHFGGQYNLSPGF
jgi:hypothetical protein